MCFTDLMIFCFSSQIAFNVDYGNFALIFGFNTFIALGMQSLLTFVLVDKNGPLVLKVTSQVSNKRACPHGKHRILVVHLVY